MPDPDHDLVAPRDSLAYFDRQSLDLPHPLTAFEAWRAIMARPLPGMAAAFRLRDAISARFGVKQIGGFKDKPTEPPRQGDMLDFFRVERAEPNHLTLTARDKHLDVMVSVLGGDRLDIAASVITHNRFGAAYMLPVAPAHRVIVWLMLRRLRRDLARPA